MKCPQCGTEFEGVVKQCFTCGWDFIEIPADYKPQTSKLAVLALILGVLCLFTLYLPLLATIVIGAIALRKIRKSRGKLTGERLAMAGILIPLLSLPIIPTIGYAIWSKDAGPVPNEFSEADLIQVKPENEVTYSILCQLNDEKDDPNGAPAIGLNKEDVELLERIHDLVSEPNIPVSEIFFLVQNHREDVLRLWENGQKGIGVIYELSAYDEIADFIEADLEEEVVFAQDIKLLSSLVRLYVLSEAAAGNQNEAIKELIVFDEIARKLNVTSRSLITKLICYALISKNLHTASIVCGHSNIPCETLQTLKDYFLPLTEEEMNRKNSMTFEYLTIKNELTKMKEGFGNKRTPILKLNSSLRYCQSHIENQIKIDAGQDVNNYSSTSLWPWDTPNWPRVMFVDHDIFSLYTRYNPTGSMLVQILFPAHDKIGLIKTKILIHDDFLQWVLNRRMGQEGSLKARAYSDEYTVDVDKGLVFSIGPDGEAYTDDDIKLRINPDVLGLK